MSTPGWHYADGDPEGTKRYWDGDQWVGDPVSEADQVSAAASGAAASSLAPMWLYAVIGSAVLSIIGAFAPWASVFGISLNGTESSDGKIVLVVGLAALVVGILGIVRPPGAKLMRIVVAIVGAIVLLIFLANYSDLNTIGIGWGFWLDGLAGAVMLALGIAGDRFFPSDS